MKSTSTDRQLTVALAAFRADLRRFLHYSELAAEKAGLLPQQHQLLLQVAGAPADTLVTVAYIAERLQLQHNSAVELCKRCEAAGFLVRDKLKENRRYVILQLTPAGKKMLGRLSRDHARELRQWAPELIASLNKIAMFDGEFEGEVE